MLIFFQYFLTNLMKVSFITKGKFKRKGGEYIHQGLVLAANGCFYNCKREIIKEKESKNETIKQI